LICFSIGEARENLIILSININMLLSKEITLDSANGFVNHLDTMDALRAIDMDINIKWEKLLENSSE